MTSHAPDPTTALLDAIVDLVVDYGYTKLTLSDLIQETGIPRQIFDQLFDDVEDCFLAACDRALADLARAITPEYLDLEASWPHRVRRTLTALLLYCDEHPDAADLLFLQMLIAGGRATRRRAQVLKSVANRLHADAPQLNHPSSPPPSSFPAQFAAQAVAGVLQARIHEPIVESRTDLLNHLTATLLLPYLGQDSTAKYLNTPETSDAVLQVPTDQVGTNVT